MDFDPAQEAVRQQTLFNSQKFTLEQKIKSSLNWFYWIGAMSIINSVISAFDGGMSFVIGLGITQLIDGIMARIATDLGTGGYIVQIFGWLIDLAVAGFFILLGYLARKKIKWLIITGLVLYILDGGFLLVLGAYKSALFHGLGIWGIISGLRLMKQLELLLKEGPPSFKPATSSMVSDFSQAAPSASFTQPQSYSTVNYSNAIPSIPAEQPEKKNHRIRFYTIVAVLLAIIICLGAVAYIVLNQ
jgi:hypothetical protein